MTSDPFDQDEIDDVEQELIETPFNPSSVDIVDRSHSVATLLERLRHRELLLTPDYQRKANLWDIKKKSRLIESILLKIPLPSFYFSEDREGNYEVVDGLQRLCSIFHFKDSIALNKAAGLKLDPLILTDLQYLKELEGIQYKDLERPFQRRIDELEIKINLIRASTPREVMFNVFARLNQGGLPLTAQEIRNAIFPNGGWREQIKEMAESRGFKQATNGKIPINRQQDMELVLRFVALLSLGPPFHRYSEQNLDEFLNNTVSKTLSEWKSNDWVRAKVLFQKGLKNATRVFQRHAFRKSYGKYKLAPIHKGLFESQVLTLCNYRDDQIGKLENSRQEIWDAFEHELLSNSPLSAALRSGTGKDTSSNIRIEFFRHVFNEALKK